MSIGLALWCGAAAQACRSKTPAQCDRSEQIQLTLDPQAQLNQDRDGYSRSLVLRVYQLAKPEAFEQVGFEELWLPTAGPPDVGALSEPDELTAIPGKQETLRIARNPRATHVGIAGNFREHLPDTGWKSLVALKPAQDPCATEAAPVAAAFTLKLTNFVMDTR